MFECVRCGEEDCVCRKDDIQKKQRGSTERSDVDILKDALAKGPGDPYCDTCWIDNKDRISRLIESHEFLKEAVDISAKSEAFLYDEVQKLRAQLAKAREAITLGIDSIAFYNRCGLGPYDGSELSKVVNAFREKAREALKEISFADANEGDKKE